MAYVATLEEVRYHIRSGFPQHVTDLLAKAAALPYIMFLEYTLHARENMQEYGITHAPKHINWGKCFIFEVAVVRGKLDKVVARVRYTKTEDIIIAVNAANHRVRSVWLRPINDTRNDTVDLTAYSLP